jgi:phosphoserine aminotransferase
MMQVRSGVPRNQANILRLIADVAPSGTPRATHDLTAPQGRHSLQLGLVDHRMNRVMNFGAGPGTLPLSALEQAKNELLDIERTGMSVLEHSHRGKTYDAVHEEALALLRTLASIPESHDILFLQGGATMQFGMVPMGFHQPGEKILVTTSGTWGEKALEDARVVAGDDVVGLSTMQGGVYARGVTDDHVRRSGVLASGEYRYVHLTSNETVHGVQIGGPDAPFPTFSAPVVCDMSSDFLSRPVDWSRFALVYAGAQKNVGPSGLCVVIAKKDFLATCNKKLPAMLRYDVAAKNRSLHNTPPVFSVYLMRNVLRWIRDEGGVPTMQKRAAERAALVYGALAKHPAVYRCPVEPAFQSQMNAIFRFQNDAHEAAFIAGAEALKMHGLRGHRSVGGMRASLYNAVPVEWAQALADYIETFGKKHG